MKTYILLASLFFATSSILNAGFDPDDFTIPLDKVMRSKIRVKIAGLKLSKIYAKDTEDNEFIMALYKKLTALAMLALNEKHTATEMYAQAKQITSRKRKELSFPSIKERINEKIQWINSQLTDLDEEDKCYEYFDRPLQARFREFHPIFLKFSSIENEEDRKIAIIESIKFSRGVRNISEIISLNILEEEKIKNLPNEFNRELDKLLLEDHKNPIFQNLSEKRHLISNNNNNLPNSSSVDKSIHSNSQITLRPSSSSSLIPLLPVNLLVENEAPKLVRGEASISPEVPTPRLASVSLKKSSHGLAAEQSALVENNGIMTVTTDNSKKWMHQVETGRFPVKPGDLLQVSYNINATEGGIIAFDLLNTRKAWFFKGSKRVVLKKGDQTGIIEYVVPEGEKEASLTFYNDRESLTPTKLMINSLRIEIGKIL